MKLELPPLPYDANALAPHVSAETLNFHHGKHHRTYVEKARQAVAGTPLENADLEEIVREAAADPSRKGLFNNSAQVWNHSFLWQSMAPGGGGRPGGAIAEHIDSDFGGYDAFAQQFKDAAVNQFGSGWAWLVLDGGRLKVFSTTDAETPIVNGGTPLLTLDVWEHAYYLDYQNRRPDYVDAFLAHLVNWDFANRNLAAAG